MEYPIGVVINEKNVSRLGLLFAFETRGGSIGLRRQKVYYILSANALQLAL